MPKGFIKTENVPQKNYSYELDGIKLSFTLRTDIKKDLKIFRSLMEKATKDIDEDLAAIKGPNEKR